MPFPVKDIRMRDVPHWSLNEQTSVFREGAVSKYQIA